MKNIKHLLDECIKNSMTLEVVGEDNLKVSFAQDSIDASLAEQLKANKQRLIYWLNSKGYQHVIKRGPAMADHALSYSQQRLWFIDQIQGGSSEYNIPAAFKVEGSLDIDLVSRTLSTIIARHEVLRTRYVEAHGMAVAKVDSTVDFSLAQHDLSSQMAQPQSEALQQLMVDDIQRPFDLQSDLMLRASYIHLSDVTPGQGNEPDRPATGVLLFNMHHIASDGWSVEVLIKEFFAVYQAIKAGQLAALPALELQYADYAYWQREALQGEGLDTQLEYWQQQLSEAPPLHGLSSDKLRPQQKQYQGALVSRRLSADTAKGLTALASAHQLTPFMLLHGALALVLSRHGNSTDIVIGTAVANRQQAELHPLIGFFVNTLVLRLDTAHQQLGDYLAHVKQVNLDAQSHQDVPFELLVERLNVPRSTAQTPLFQIMLTINTDYGVNSATEVEAFNLPGVTLSPLDSGQVTAAFDLDFSISLSNEGVYLGCKYDVMLFDESQMQSMLSHLARLLGGLADVAQATTPSSQVRIAELPLLSAGEIQALLYDLNDTAADFAIDQSVHQVLMAQAKQTPDNIALMCGETTLSYQQLDWQSQRLALHLLDIGIKPADVVGIYSQPSIDLVVALLAVLKIGAVFALLDVDYPQPRINYIIDNSNIGTLLTTQAQDCDFIDNENLLVVALDTLTLAGDADGQQLVDAWVYNGGDAGGNDGACVFYTSGSTGQPKGALFSHRGLVNYARSMIDKLGCVGQDRFLQISSVSFDVILEELLPCLLSGGAVVLNENVTDMATLNDQLETKAINFFEISFAQWREWLYWLNKHQRNPPACLKNVLVGCESIPRALMRQWQTYDVALTHVYGLTETTITTTTWCSEQLDINQFDIMPMGKPIANTQVFILDHNMNLTPKMAVGELYIGGAGLALRYINQPALTAERFIDNPFYQPGHRNSSKTLYKTGDLVRYFADGHIKFIGRVDEQVKVRGFRIELGEVETRLNQQDSVDSALVMVNTDSQGDKQLVGYVKAKLALNASATVEGQAQLIQTIKQDLNVSLPDYMVPGLFVLVDEWPLTSNGKIDKKALPQPDATALQGEYVAAKTETEKSLLIIWAALLDIDATKTSASANFFELGGHSLLAMRVVADIQAQFEQKIKIQNLFAYPTIVELAQHIDQLSTLDYIKKTEQNIEILSEGTL